MSNEGAQVYLPERLTLSALRRAAATCEGCPLFQNATQTVFGNGLVRARLMLVGEQPGDKEDLAGEPFVGPAGRVLDQGLESAGIDRDDVYLTNAVKHFKFTDRGKRRIHKKPNLSEIRACRPWLDAEVEVVKPGGIVALGATAAQALFGPQFKVSRRRGELVESELAPLATATVHPSSILRAPDSESRRAAMDEFTRDLEAVARHMA